MLLNDYVLFAIDPSLKQTGWSVLKISHNKESNYNDFYDKDINIEILDYGIIPTHSLEHGKALLWIEQVIQNTIEKYKPDYVTLEAPFVGNNRDTIQKLAHIHGVLQLISAKNNLPLTYYSVMSAKKAVLGQIVLKKEDGTRKTGEELKEEVATEILNIFGKDSFKKEYNLDITDAISIGICFIKNDGKEIKKPKKTRKKKTTKK